MCSRVCSQNSTCSRCPFVCDSDFLFLRSWSCFCLCSNSCRVPLRMTHCTSPLSFLLLSSPLSWLDLHGVPGVLFEWNNIFFTQQIWSRGRFPPEAVFLGYLYILLSQDSDSKLKTKQNTHIYFWVTVNCMMYDVPAFINWSSSTYITEAYLKYT